MSTLDKDYNKLNWQQTKDIAESGQIHRFGRTPSELRRYEEYCHDLKQKYGSILYFIQHERLNWPTIEPSGDAPFTNESDFRILFNDWPYALDEDIKHLIIWTKFPIGEEDDAGHLTPGSIVEIEQYIVSTFCSEEGGRGSRDGGVSRQNLVWFKNWKSLRSVHALEHLHVLLYQASEEFLKSITNNDVPMSKQLEN